MAGDIPDQRIEIPSTLEMNKPVAIANTSDPNIIEPPPSPPVPLDHSDEFLARGHRITHIRTYPDGTQDIIYLEG
jgi:hypothetical protein